MANASWGHKHVCTECETSFYDMQRKPIACPKCGKTHQRVALLKSDGRPPPRKKRLPETVVRAAVPEAEEAEVEADAEELDDALAEDAEDEETEEADAVSEERER